MRPRLPDASAVLSGKVRASVEQMFALIHAANPTDRGLSPRETSERYALKSRLQSFLIHHHADVLEVVRDGGDGVVSLRHRIAGRDAAHAVIAALDEDARRWVETELALVAPAPAAAPTWGTTLRRGGAAADDALARGRRALADYDYDGARTLLEAAFHDGHGDLAPACALLDLLVNHLADDAAAVSLEAALSPDAAGNPEVRGALALASARLGDRDRATRWLRGLAGPATADAWVAVADLALHAADVDSARIHLTRLREADAAHPAIARIAAQLERVRRDERSPLEAQLVAAMTEDAWERVDVDARAILARWPESEPARAALRTVEIRQRHARAAELAAKAGRAWEARDGAGVLALVKQARPLADGNAELSTWLDEAEEAARDAVELASMQRVRTLLADGALDAALRIWLALDADLRAEFSARLPRAEFAWITEMPDADGRVEAALGLAAAVSLLAHGDAGAALAAVAPHLRLVRACRDGRALVADAERQVRARRADADMAAVDAASAALAAGNLEDAESLLSGVPASAASSPILARIAAERDRRHWQREGAQAEAAGDFEHARACADRVGDAARDQLKDRLAAAWRPTRHDDADGTLHAFLINNTTPAPRPWMSPDGHTIAFVRAFGEQLVVWVCESDTLAVRVASTWRLPVPCVESSWQIDGDLVSIVFQEVALVCASIADGRVLRWCRPVATIEQPQGAVLAPGGRFVWVLCGTARSSAVTRVYDVERWPSWQAAPTPGTPMPLWGLNQPAVAIGGIRLGTTFHHPNGRAMPGKSYMPSLRVSRVVPNSDGEPVFAVVDMSEKAAEVRAHQDDDEIREHLPVDPLGVAFAIQKSEMGRVSVFAGASISKPHMLATSRLEDRVYGLVTVGGRSEVLWFDPESMRTNSNESGRVPVPANAVLVHDARGNRVRLLHYTTGGLAIAIPDAENSEFLDGSVQAHLEAVLPMDGMDFSLGCAYTPGWISPDADALASVFRGVPEAGRDAWVTDFLKRNEGEPDLRYDLVAAIGNEGMDGRAQEILNATAERFPDHVRTRLAQAWFSSTDGKWAEVKEYLDGVDVSRLPGLARQHAMHLLGIAELRVGKRKKAERILRSATKVDGGSCALGTVIAMFDVLAGKAAPPKVTDQRSYCLRRFGSVVRGMLDSDTHLAANDWEAAVAALDHATIWRAEELQSSARLAQAWLGIEGGGLRKWLAFAGFLGARDAMTRCGGHDIPLGDIALGSEALTALESRVREELDRMCTAGGSATG